MNDDYEDEVFKLLKEENKTIDQLIRLSELFDESQKKDKGRSYIKAYNGFLSSLKG